MTKEILLGLGEYSRAALKTFGNVGKYAGLMTGVSGLLLEDIETASVPLLTAGLVIYLVGTSMQSLAHSEERVQLNRRISRLEDKIFGKAPEN